MITSLVLFFLFIIVYMVISDVITVFFRLTGMTEEKARFQVVSLLTNSGFTTKESEAIVSSKIRRRLARGTMVFGYAFTVTIVSTTVNFFMTIDRSELGILGLVIPILILILVIVHLIRHSLFFKTRFDRWIEKIGSRIMFGKNANSIILVEEYGSSVLAHIYLHTVPEFLRDVPLYNSGLTSKYNIMVLTVKSKSGDAVQAVAETVLQQDDLIMVLGKKKTIRDIFEKVETKEEKDEAEK